MITVLKSPVVTEKATKVGQLNQYVFLVDPSANKIQIKAAIKQMFDVDAVSVRTVRIKGKVKQRYTRSGWHSQQRHLTERKRWQLEISNRSHQVPASTA